MFSRLIGLLSASMMFKKAYEPLTPQNVHGRYRAGNRKGETYFKKQVAKRRVKRKVAHKSRMINRRKGGK